MLKKELEKQLKITRKALEPDQEVFVGLCEFCNLIDIFHQYLEAKYAQENNEESSESFGERCKALFKRSKTGKRKKEST